jgi:hypothetical protein
VPNDRLVWIGNSNNLGVGRSLTVPLPGLATVAVTPYTIVLNVLSADRQIIGSQSVNIRLVSQ